MKTLITLLLSSLLLTSCAGTYQEIGSLSMLSDRHVDPNGRYVKLSVAAGSTKKELRKATSTNIEDAIDHLLDQVPGGRYLTNVKVYVVKNDCIAVSGDVWGQPVSTSAAKTDGKLILKASSMITHDINKVSGTVNSFDSNTETIAK